MTRTIRNLGGARSAACYAGFRAMERLGFYRRWQRVEWNRVQRLVFVCSGNICRSPYASELARLRGIPTLSFGIDACGEAPADPEAIRIAKNTNISLAHHRSMRAGDYESRAGDLLLAMEPRQLIALEAMSNAKGIQSSLLGLWSMRRTPYVPDPFGRGEECFNFVFSLIADAVANIADRLPSVRSEIGRARD